MASHCTRGSHASRPEGVLFCNNSTIGKLTWVCIRFADKALLCASVVKMALCAKDCPVTRKVKCMPHGCSCEWLTCTFKDDHGAHPSLQHTC